MDPLEEITRQEPMQVFRDWLALATESEPNDPNAAALATATPDAVPSVRMVLIKGAEDRGLRFFTHTVSQKGEELLLNPEAAIVLHWKSLRRQVRFCGKVERLSAEEAAEYFHSRSRGSQIAAVVSNQSQPLPSRALLDDAVRAYKEQLGDREVPVPEDWIGFLLSPRQVEFWSDGKDRLHDRIRFTREGAGWSAVRVYP